ncbi:n-alpha-acetyltransferase 20 family [Trichomonas vaginalis G3]|uniref:n-alpha-acetyltransferase 20 family n=1 Tax=Trichomonas vaginalis (strain ATCC PRA-98 / G3) TaxID=412133 RepID=UPI0021E551E3|nr:n-alpha-acetyltransferase 20 family [Trichomonas vaginalis G3]KAI5552781.1 n-alpha-acetyltransferase 20 family [Trichomonas vaginalis G3]
MVSIQPFKFEDLWEVNRINIDDWTETFSTSFYLYYMNKAPSMNWMISNNSEEKVGYIIGSIKRHDNVCRTHVIAVTVAEDARRLGLATSLMNIVETTCENQYKGLCVGLYVRPTNYNAHELYKKMGYILYRRIIKYYETIGEDGWDMRKSLKWDKDKVFMKPIENPVTSEEAESDDDDD